MNLNQALLAATHALAIGAPFESVAEDKGVMQHTVARSGPLTQ